MECSLPGSSVPGIFQTSLLEWVAIYSSRRSSRPRDQTCVSCIGRQILYHRTTREALKSSNNIISQRAAMLYDHSVLPTSSDGFFLMTLSSPSPPPSPYLGFLKCCCHLTGFCQILNSILIKLLKNILQMILIF